MSSTKMHGFHFFWYLVLYCAVHRNGMCTEISSCEELEAPMHGTVNQTAEIAWFNCSEGYTLQGSEIIHCNMSNHTWAGETHPNCSKDETRNSSSVQTPGPFDYLGCYNDVNIFKLKVFPDIGKYDPLLTLEKCWEMCSIARTAYFGVEQSHFCFCGKESRNFKIHGSSTKCKMTCAGNSNQFCGGQFAIDVYKIVYPSCEVLDAPLYGTVYQTAETAWFDCFDGYILQGSEVIHCNKSNYKWNGETNPICSQTTEIGITIAKHLPATSEKKHSTKTAWTENTISVKGNTVSHIPPWLLLALILPSFFMVIVLIGGICLLSKNLSLTYSRNQESIKRDTENHIKDQYSPGYLTPAASLDQASPGYLSPTASILAKRMPSEVFYRVSEDEQPYEVLQTYHNCNVNQQELIRDISSVKSTFTGQPYLGNGVISHFILPSCDTGSISERIYDDLLSRNIVLASENST